MTVAFVLVVSICKVMKPKGRGTVEDWCSRDRAVMAALDVFVSSICRAYIQMS